MIRLILINPNSDQRATQDMVAVARAALPELATLEALTAPFGPRLIVDDGGLAIAARAVLALRPKVSATPCQGVIVSAFGDPGVFDLRRTLRCPVTGIAEAGMAEAVRGERPFAVITTTLSLKSAIAAIAIRYGHSRLYRGAIITPGDPQKLMADPQHLVEALSEACAIAIRDLGVEALVIGGGPLAVAARALSGIISIPLIEPVAAAVRLALRRTIQVRPLDR